MPPILPKRALIKGMRVVSSELARWATALSSSPSVSGADRLLLRRNSRFDGIFAGRRCFVLGNGPSLNALNLESLTGEISIACNGFSCHPILDTWQPYALCLADPDYFLHADRFAAEFKRIGKRMPTTEVFAPLEGVRVLSECGAIRPDFLNFCCLHSNMVYHRTFSVDLTMPVPMGQTVTLFAIAVSLYLGCDPIYLLGMDHDFLAQPKKPTHFSDDYDTGDSPEEVLSYSSWSYLRLIRAVGNMFEGHSNLRRVAQGRGQRIINASAGGFLDVYPRVVFSELFDGTTGLH